MQGMEITNYREQFPSLKIGVTLRRLALVGGPQPPHKGVPRIGDPDHEEPPEKFTPPTLVEAVPLRDITAGKGAGLGEGEHFAA